MKQLAREYQQSSLVLFEKEFYKASYYLLGYSVELALKWKICRTHNLQVGFPETVADLREYRKRKHNCSSFIKRDADMQTLRSHSFENLLRLTGVEVKIKRAYFPEWLVLLQWSPEIRYVLKELTAEEAIAFSHAAQEVVRLIFK